MLICTHVIKNIILTYDDLKYLRPEWPKILYTRKWLFNVICKIRWLCVVLSYLMWNVLEKYNETTSLLYYLHGLHYFAWLLLIKTNVLLKINYTSHYITINELYYESFCKLLQHFQVLKCIIYFICDFQNVRKWNY